LLKEVGSDSEEGKVYVFAVAYENEGFRAAILPQNEESNKLKEKIEENYDYFGGIEEVILQVENNGDYGDQFVVYGTLEELNEPPQRKEEITFAYGEINRSKRDSSASGTWELKQSGSNYKPYIKILENLNQVDIIREFTPGNGGFTGVTDDRFYFIFHAVVTEGE
jgi:hypothetical protein